MTNLSPTLSTIKRGPTMNWYHGKKVFITGGSSGIGKATAKLLAGFGASVMVAARGEERLQHALAEIEQQRSSETQVLGAVPLDVGDPDAARQVASRVLEQLGGLDVLINNAGIAHPAYLHETPAAVHEQMMRVNYLGTAHVTAAFLPHFMARRQGNVANVSSVVGFLGIFGYAAYAASKFAVSGYSECLRQDLLPYNVKVSVLFPPDTDTPQWHQENEIKPPETKAIAGAIKVMSPETVARALLKGIAAGRFHILPGLMTRLTWLAYRHTPWLVRFFLDRSLKKHLRSSQESQ